MPSQLFNDLIASTSIYTEPILSSSELSESVGTSLVASVTEGRQHAPLCMVIPQSVCKSTVWLEYDNRGWCRCVLKIYCCRKSYHVVDDIWQMKAWIICSPFCRHSLFTRANRHYIDVIMVTMASQITSRMVVYSTVYLSAAQRKHQNSASLALVWGIHRWPVNSPHKGPVTRKIFPVDDVIMQ